jgi:hypothetical protein
VHVLVHEVLEIVGAATIGLAQLTILGVDGDDVAGLVKPLGLKLLYFEYHSSLPMRGDNSQNPLLTTFSLNRQKWTESLRIKRKKPYWDKENQRFPIGAYFRSYLLSKISAGRHVTWSNLIKDSPKTSCPSLNSGGRYIRFVMWFARKDCSKLRIRSCVMPHN